MVSRSQGSWDCQLSVRREQVHADRWMVPCSQAGGVVAPYSMSCAPRMEQGLRCSPLFVHLAVRQLMIVTYSEGMGNSQTAMTIR